MPCDGEDNDAMPPSARLGTNLWRRDSDMARQKSMKALRQDITDNRDPRESVLEMEAGSGMADMENVLKARDLSDGRNLLMHAAVSGRKAWFLALVDDTKARLGATTLAKRLRELDGDRAPLLFLAASSRSVRCLKAVQTVIWQETGLGGLTEQVHAVDKYGRTIGMYAAWSGEVKVHSEVQKLLDDEWRHAGQQTLEEHRMDRLLAKDDDNLTLLHHAASKGSPKVLENVIKMAKTCNVYSEINVADNEGRTPVMCALRADYLVSQPASDTRAQYLREKLHFLLRECTTENEWLKCLTQPSIGSKTSTTALMYAARGGRESFSLAVELIRNASRNDGSFAVQIGTGSFSAAEAEIGGASGDPDTTRGTSNALPTKEESEFDCELVDLALGARVLEGQHDLRAKRRGMLLAEATKSGDLSVLQKVVDAIQTVTATYPVQQSEAFDGYDSEKQKKTLDAVGREELIQALDTLSERGQAWLTLAITSGNIRMAKWVVAKIYRLYDDRRAQPAEKRWDIISGKSSTKRSLACAASALPTANRSGRTMFTFVIRALRKAAEQVALTEHANVDSTQKRADCVRRLLVGELLYPEDSDRYTPLACAVIHQNRIMFNKVYTEVTRQQEQWDEGKVWGQLRGLIAVAGSSKADHGQGRKTALDISASMWRPIIEAFERIEGENGGKPKSDWRRRFRITVNEVAARGDFDRLRALVKGHFPLHEHISVLLTRIGDHEEDVIEAVMLAVTISSNPFVMCATTSTAISKAMTLRPMHRRSLGRLQEGIDEFMIEVLENLPHTVRGVGMELLGTHKPVGPNLNWDPAKRDMVATRLGYVIVRWMFEPSQTSPYLKDDRSLDGTETIDPLQLALDRGSKALEFVNAPLVLDYVHLKFWSPLPGWASRNPHEHTIDIGLYTSSTPNGIAVQSTGPGPDKEKGLANSTFHQKLLRFLQGVEAEDDPTSDRPSSRQPFPHNTLLPGLQFYLACIIGKPETFYAVPAVRFAYEILSYIVMLALFCSCVSIENSYRVPANEWAFYAFVAGLLWREILEFRQALPRRAEFTMHRSNPGLDGLPHRTSVAWTSTDKRQDRVAHAVSTYLFYDTWNILDTLTVCCVAVAFTCRMIALYLHEDWTADTVDDEGFPGDARDWSYAAQLFLATSAPLLFARVLCLCQIDDTLGPMAQIIWTMLSHLARFSVFLVVVMASFAVAFHALFFACEKQQAADLVEYFGSFWTSLLFLFRAMFGDIDFSIFKDADLCSNNPRWAYDVSVWLLVVYLVIMSILLMNLLIAILTTVHADVYANAEKEFHLTRAKLVLQIGHAVAQCDLPAPLNLVKVLLGVGVDSGHFIWLLLVKSRVLTKGSYHHDKNGQDSRPRRPDTLCTWRILPWAWSRAMISKPVTDTYNWRTIEATVHRIMFICTMGVASLTILVVLWIVSVPWIAWRLLDRAFPARLEDTWQGYTWTAFSKAPKIAGWLLTTATVGIVSSLVFAGASLILWVCGMVGLWTWLKWRWTKGRQEFIENGHCRCMPGEDQDPNWGKARIIAKERNYVPAAKQLSGHFNVGTLLQMASGLDTMEVWLRINRGRDIERTRESLSPPNRFNAQQPRTGPEISTHNDTELEHHAWQGWRAPSEDGRRVTRLVNTIKPDKNESRVYSSDEHGFRLTVPKETSTDGGRSCGPPEPAAGPILLEHTSIVVRCGPHAFLVTSVVHCLPYDASLTKPIILDFAGDVDSTALGQYKVLMFDEEHISWQTSPEKLLPNNDQSFFRLETMRFTRFALGKIISGLAPDCAPSAIDISPPRWRFTSERDGEGLEVTVYNVLETGTSLMLVAVPVVMPANFPPALEQRRQPRVLYSEGFSSTRSARVPAGGNTKLAAGRSDADEVVVIVATVDAREVIVWGDRRMHAGQRMAIMKKFFDGGPLIGPELVDGSTTRSRQIVTMHRRSSISSDPLQPAASAGVKAADVGPDKGERLDGGAPFR